jgi:hypothetical protein
MHIIYAERYVSPRERPLTPEEQEVRRIAYAICGGALMGSLWDRKQWKTVEIGNNEKTGLDMKNPVFLRKYEVLKWCRGTDLNRHALAGGRF